MAACSGYSATPMLAPSTSDTSPEVNGDSNSASTTSASPSTASWSVTSRHEHGELVAGEPGQLRPLGQQRLDAVAHLLEEPVAGGDAERVVDLLEGHQVDEHEGHAELAAPRLGDRRLEALLEHRAVRQAGDRIVERLVRLLLRIVLERGDQPTVGEGDVGVVGQRLEQAQVVLDERADLGEPVGDDHRADGHAVGGERHDRRVLHPDLAEPPRQRLAGRVQPGFVARQQQAEVGGQLVGRDAGPDHVVVAHEEPAGLHAVPHGRQQQRHVLAPQDLPRPERHRLLELVDLDRIAERPGEVVERLEVLVALASARCRRGSSTNSTADDADDQEARRSDSSQSEPTRTIPIAGVGETATSAPNEQHLARPSAVPGQPL